MNRPIAIVSEDRLTEAVLLKCVKEFLPNHIVARSDVRGGRGNVQRELPAYSNLSRSMPVLVGVDLDGDICPLSLLRAWGSIYTPRPTLLVRVAVREIEAWVLADRKRVAKFIDAPSDEVLPSPEESINPKDAFLNLARKYAKGDLKRELVPRNFGQYPRSGPAYNLRMCEFVANKWRPNVARKRSQSLSRAISAIELLNSTDIII